MGDNNFHIDNWLREAAAHQAGAPAGDAVKQKAWAQLRGRMDGRGSFWQRYGSLVDVVLLVTMGVFVWWSSGMYVRGDVVLLADDKHIDVKNDSIASQDYIAEQASNGKVSHDHITEQTSHDKVSEEPVNIENIATDKVSEDSIAKQTSTGNISEDHIAKPTSNSKVSQDHITAQILNGKISKERITKQTSTGNISKNARDGIYEDETPIGIKPQNDAPQIKLTNEADINAVFIPILPINDRISQPQPLINRAAAGRREEKTGVSVALALPLPMNGEYGAHPAVAYDLKVSERWFIRPHASVLYLRNSNANYTHATTKPNVDTIIMPGTTYLLDSVVSNHSISAQLFGSFGVQGVYQRKKVSISAGIAYYHYLYSSRSKVTDSTQYHEITSDVRVFQREAFNAAKLSGSRNLQLQLGAGYMITPRLQAGLNYTMPVFKSRAQKGLTGDFRTAVGTTRLELQVRWFFIKK